jgi:hypothetical protein
MALKRTFADDSEMRQIAMEILATCGGERRIILQVQALMNSNEEMVPKAEALKKLRALHGECPQPLTKLRRRSRLRVTAQEQPGASGSQIGDLRRCSGE